MILSEKDHGKFIIQGDEPSQDGGEEPSESTIVQAEREFA